MVSIVVPSCNSENFIGRTLAAIYAQNRRDFEVLSCDHESSDRTGWILDSYPAIRRLAVPPDTMTFGKLLNCAVPECRGDIVVFNHADACPLDADYLQQLLLPFDDPTVAASFGSQECHPDADFPARREQQQAFKGAPQTGKTPEFSLMSAAIRTSVLRRFPFNPRLPLAVASEWANRVKAAGGRIVYTAAARVEYSCNRSWSELYRYYRQLGCCRAEALGEVQPLSQAFRGFLAGVIDDLRSIRESRNALAFPAILPWRTIRHFAYYRGICAASDNNGAKPC